MATTTDLILSVPQLASFLLPHLTQEELGLLPITNDVNIRAVLEIDRGVVRGGMSVNEYKRLRIEGAEPLDVAHPVAQDVSLKKEIVFDILMYALNTHPQIAGHIITILGYMPTVVPPADLGQESEAEPEVVPPAPGTESEGETPITPEALPEE